MDIAASFYLSAAEIGLTLSGLALLMVCAFAGNRTARLVTILAVAALFGAMVFTIDLFNTAGTDLAWGGIFIQDRFASFAKVLIYLACMGCLIVTPTFFDRAREYRPEYPVLMIFGAVGMGLMVSAVDLMQLYIGLELTSLASYVLASFSRSDDRSAEAGLKYFVLGALASGILLYGMSLIYGFTGSTDYFAIRLALELGLNTGALFGVVFVMAGLAFKIAAVPFHMWTPDVYEGAPTPVTTFFATAPKVAAIVILMRMALIPFGAQVDAWQQIVIFAALASIVVGALGAIGQDNIKRLLAYSSINNVGFHPHRARDRDCERRGRHAGISRHLCGHVARQLRRGAYDAGCRRAADRGDRGYFGAEPVATHPGAISRDHDAGACRYTAFVRFLGQIRRLSGGGAGGHDRTCCYRHCG